MRKKKTNEIEYIKKVLARITQIKEFACIIIDTCFVQDMKQFEMEELKQKYDIAGKLTYTMFDLLEEEQANLQEYINIL